MILMPGAVWRGPVPNETPGGVRRPFLGCVLHITGSSYGAADGWFHNRAAQASAHFIVDYDGTIYQEVSLDDKAWAEAAGNPYYVSIETVGISTTEPLTNAQVASVSRIYAFCQALDKFPFALAEAPGQRGFGWHGMGGTAWGGHPYCPGEPRKAQRPLILQLAQGLQPHPKEEDMGPAIRLVPGEIGQLPVSSDRPFRLIMVSDFAGANVRAAVGSQRPGGPGFPVIQELWIPGWRVGWDNTNVPGGPKGIEVFSVANHPGSKQPVTMAVEYPV